MVIHNVDNLLKETSEVTSYPPDVIMSVIDHQFKSLYDYIDKPTTPGIRFPYLGLFSPKYRAVINYLHLLIRKLRLDRDNEQLKERFRAY